MEGKPFKAGAVINLSEGEEVKDAVLVTVPKGRLFVIEFVGINAFLQPNQQLFVALQVITASLQGIYPIAVPGHSTFPDPTYPVRVFGSQRVLLYADAKSEVILTASRSNGGSEARIFVDCSGRMLRPTTRQVSEVEG